MFAKNKSDLIKTLKNIQGKAIFKLTRVNSFQDGEFVKVLYDVKNDKIILVGEDMQKGSLYFSKANEIEFLENGFKINNVILELIKLMEC